MDNDFNLIPEIGALLEAEHPDCALIMTDSNVALIARDLISALQDKIASLGIRSGELIITPAGEEHKDFASLEAILARMTDSAMTRRSLLICIGGGMATDMGGFAAAIFKRGIRHINVATTLLGAVDAAVGGKTAIDFHGLKNEVGAFHLPIATLAAPSTFASLPDSELLSGFGEVIKTAFIADEKMTRRLLGVNPLEADSDLLDEVCRFCRDEKMRVVDADPTEKGLRKILNFGHTAGHAVESLLLEKGRPVAHGIAIAHGILISLLISMMQEGLQKSWVSDYARWLRSYYPEAHFTCKDYDRILQLASHDKKNTIPGIFSFTLLRRPGDPVYDCPVTPDTLKSALDLYQELLGR